MKIGQLAAATDTQVETIRYYEREGLLPPPARSEGNYRVYDNPHVTRLAFIRHCRALDLNLSEIRSLLHVRDAPEAGCGEVNALVDAHIDQVGVRIRQLQALEGELKALRAHCSEGRSVMACGILDELTRDAKEGVNSCRGAQSGLALSPLQGARPTGRPLKVS
jgi:Cd(II)/Pb(II)-responsive transcriptional regulator